MSGGARPGPLALVGSGEFTHAMEDVDRGLLDGRPQRAVFLPTAAAPEGEARLRYWVDLGEAHYRRLGVEPVPLRVRNRSDAEDHGLAAQVEGAGLVYLSGGNPAFLADTLRGSAVGQAIGRAWQAGAAVAGCSAGAMAMMDRVPHIRERDRTPTDGLGFVRGVVVLPHFDQMERWMSGATELALKLAPPGYRVLGIDEDTAVVGGPVEWRVAGRQSAWLLSVSGQHRRFGAGEVLQLDAHGEGSQAPEAPDGR
ncbi:MAG TPA: Type 1 glutamine amidotransferase-like domain-containing protein [Candidatus Solibacter sp.]|jgi:cyanophycinase|nr:Type 1 glutamine amidotransferase-like domain-containing protein [Candidatus Solibacter sp.]